MESQLSRIQSKLDRDYEVITELYLKQFTIAEMCVELQKITNETYTLSVSQMKHDLQKVKAALHEPRQEKIEQLRNEKLAEIALVKKTAYIDGEKSKQDRISKTITKAKIMAKNKGNAEIQSGDDNIITTINQTSSYGDSVYLKIILECIKEENKLLGLYAPEKVEHTGGIVWHETKTYENNNDTQPKTD
jgi:hypothetical protein